MDRREKEKDIPLRRVLLTIKKIYIGTPSTLGMQPSKTSKVVDVLSSSRISKGNVERVFTTCDGSFIADKEMERRDLTSRFIYRFCFLKEAHSPC
jgi:hypothetical protein